MKLSIATVLIALTCLGVEPAEGADATALLDETLEGYGLTTDQFLTEETVFSLGYHRALQGRPFTDDQVPHEGDKPDAKLIAAIENGYAFGLEAREVGQVPPPSLVFEGFSSGKLEYGCLSTWLATVDLKKTFRLSHAVEVGSGKNAMTVPAGTPVDVLGETEKDGVETIIVAYDGVALLIPNPKGDPRIVTGDTIVAPVKAKRVAKPRDPNAPPKVQKERVERGPTLKDVIVDVIEGNEGGNGPLQTNGVFAGRVLALARTRGIGDKASTFMQHADKHVPYYLNCYKPEKGTGHTGRLGVEKPKTWVIAAIEGRKYFLGGPADATRDARLALIPADIQAKMQDRESTVATTAAPPKEKKEKADADAEAGEAASA